MFQRINLSMLKVLSLAQGRRHWGSQQPLPLFFESGGTALPPEAPKVEDRCCVICRIFERALKQIKPNMFLSVFFLWNM